MSRLCAVPFCGMKYKQRKRFPGLSFHEFPADLTLREKWLTAIRRQSFIPQDTDCVCSIHFHASDFKRGLKVVRLQPYAVPSVFPSFPKYLQLKKKPERRVIKRASPEVIASFKRKRRKKHGTGVQATTNEEPIEYVDSDTNQIYFEVEDQVEYEVIPLDKDVLEFKIPAADSPTMRDASTQASGMWEKIQELYKMIRKLRAELQKKTNEISNLTSQNKKLQKQLENLKSQKIVRPENKKSALVKKKLVKENVQIKNEDLSRYLHPRVPRSLCPPKNSASNNPKVVLSVNHLNQVMVSHTLKTPENLTANSINFESREPNLFSPNSLRKQSCENVRDSDQNSEILTVTPEVMCDETTSQVLIKKESAADDTSISLLNATSAQSVPPVVHNQENFCYPPQEYDRENGSEMRTDTTLDHDQRTNDNLLLVQENFIVESHCDEVVIYSSENVNHFESQGIHNSVESSS